MSVATDPPHTTLLSEDTIQARVRELAAQLSEDYADCDDLILIGVLKGAFVFLADIARALTIPRSVDFIAVSSYQGDISSGSVRLLMDSRRDVKGKHVVIVEDIVDSGRTLHYLTELFKTRNPASVSTCVLVRKLDRIEVEAQIDYLGFDIPDVWVVGYGLDFDEKLRVLPYIAEIEPQ
jgi:hypoxanthine phosphoribosyltransferase